MNNNIIKKKENKINNGEIICPEKIHFLKDISNDSYSDYILDNSFCALKSFYNDVIYLIYSTKNKSIISYDLIDNKKLIEVRKAHNSLITNFRHCFDKINETDLIISISADDNNLKLWNFNNFECLLNLKNINETGKLYSSCFLNNNNHYYIITSQYRKYLGNISELIKVFDLKGNKIKEIPNSNDRTCFIDTYNDYIITANYNYVKSYEFNKNIIYKIYSENDNQNHYSAIINHKKDSTTVELIEISEDGNVRIWDFHMGILLRKIKVGNDFLCGICFLNNNMIFVGCEDKTIELIDLNKGNIIKNLIGHRNNVITVKKIIHPLHGICLISKGYANDKMKMWICKI